jgi:hypothetical protein
MPATLQLSDLRGQASLERGGAAFMPRRGFAALQHTHRALQGLQNADR